MGETSIGLAIALLTRQDENLVHLRKAKKMIKKINPNHSVSWDRSQSYLYYYFLKPSFSIRAR